MEYEILDQNTGILRIAKLAAERNIIPVFGSGFTFNSRSHGGLVPDGATATRIMTDMLLSNCDAVSLDDLKNN